MVHLTNRNHTSLLSMRSLYIRYKIISIPGWICLVSFHSNKVTIFTFRANLSDQYFEQRQDRYVLFQDAPELANYYSTLVDTVGKFSFHLDASNRLSINDPRRLHPYQTSLDNFVQHTHNLLNRFVEPNKQPEETVPFDTHVYPLVQMGQLKVR